nr:pulmonary surfactant-associated protein C-like [Pogona vitticeps]
MHQMESKANCEVNMASELPAYKFIPTVPKDRKQIIFISVILVLLTIVITGAILIGINTSQEHTEKIIRTLSNGAHGEVVEQTVMVNQQDSVAAFHIQSNKTSATVVYDYYHKLIGFRIHNKRKCSVVSMDLVAVPSLDEVTQKIEHFGQQVPGDDTLSYSFKKGKMADRTTLGTTINILCSDLPVYWAEKSHKEQRKGPLPCLGILIIQICLTLF